MAATGLQSAVRQQTADVAVLANGLATSYGRVGGQWLEGREGPCQA
jgi:hypothetical protein